MENQPQTEPNLNSELPEHVTAQEMLQKINSIDTDTLDVQKLANELKGKNQLYFSLVMPVALLLIVLLTFIAYLITTNIIISFFVASLIVILLGKLATQHETKYSNKARILIIQRISEYETDAGILTHFKEFLPKRYRHLWQCLKKGNYRFIEQYISAVQLLQSKLDAQQFIKVWDIKNPPPIPEKKLEKE